MRGEIIRWFIVLIVAGASGIGLLYTYQYMRPCAHPISYAIGAFDSRFDVTQATLLAEAKTAANIWNKAAGKTVLVYDPDAEMKINLIYDEREANAKIGRRIARQQESMDNARTALDALQAQYAAKQDVYNEKVDAVNARGGATRNEAVTLNAERDSLNALADSLNAQFVTFNASVATFNATVKEYNQTAGKTFQAGQYVRDATGENINIFEFIGSIQLERVLAHEFGHAIGLDHNNDSKSIMFAQNESGNLVPTASDLSSLRALCGA